VRSINSAGESYRRDVDTAGPCRGVELHAELVDWRQARGMNHGSLGLFLSSRLQNSRAHVEDKVSQSLTRSQITIFEVRQRKVTQL